MTTKAPDMFHRVPVALLLITVFTLSSCRKEEDLDCTPGASSATLDIATFSQLAIGNYWVYERRQVDSLDVPINENVRIDSLFISGDTVLNGLTYAVIREAQNGGLVPMQRFWRDSADCIVTSDHEILFCSATFNQVVYTHLQSPFLQTDYSVSSAMVPLAVPAGEFSAFVMRGQVTSFAPYPVLPEWKHPRSYWAYGVGRLKWSVTFMSSPFAFRYELLRYHIG